jgi:anterior pharynx defective protein 1
MTALTFFGCAFVAYGPPLALFVGTVAPDAVRVIVLILSAFGWLFSLLLSSVVWFAVVPLKDTLAFGLVFSVAFQELFRLLIYWMFHKTDALLKKLTENEHTKIFNNRHILSYVVGLGFGLMSGAFSLVNVLADSVGPGTVGFHGEPQSFWMVSAATCLAVILCHPCWNVIAFASVEERRYWGVCYVWASHFLVSCLVSYCLYFIAHTMLHT